MKKLLAILLMVALLAGCGTAPKNETVPSESTDSTAAADGEGTVAATEPLELPELEIKGTPGYGNNDVFALNHYTVAEASPSDSNMTAVLAVATAVYLVWQFFRLDLKEVSRIYRSE